MITAFEVDELWIRLGNWGKYQILQLTLYFFANIVYSTQILSTVFVAYRPPHRCEQANLTDLVPNINTNTTYSIEYEQCSIEIIGKVENNTVHESSMECLNGHTYDIPKDRTLVTEMDFVCSRTSLAELTQTVLFLGLLVGAFVFPAIADRCGRKPVHICCLLGLLGAAIGVAYAPNYAALAIFRFLVGAFQQGAGLAGAIMTLEILPRNLRYIGECLGQATWVIGCVLLTPIAYWFRNSSWRHLQLCISLLTVHSFLLYWIMDESLRWLIANGRLVEAERVIKKACRWNKVKYSDVMSTPLTGVEDHAHLDNNEATTEKTNGLNHLNSPDDDENADFQETVVEVKEVEGKNLKYVPAVEIEVSKNKVEKYTLLTIFQHRHILRTSVIIWYTWFVVAMVYYALTLTSALLSGDRYINYFLIVGVEILAPACQYFTLNRLGRRRCVIMFQAVTGVSLIISTLIREFAAHTTWANPVSLVFYLLGKLGVAGTFSSIYLFTPELYPTNLRNVGIGMSSGAARVGAMLAPFAGTLSAYIQWGPGIISAVLCLVSMYLMRYLPETVGRELPTTTAEMNQWFKDNAGNKKKTEHENE